MLKEKKLKDRTKDWKELSSTSHYKTALAIKEELKIGNIEEANTGLEEMIESLSRSDKRALRSQLIRLMTHIIKWKPQPYRRSLSWVATIKNAREEIRDIQDETPSLTDEVIQNMWIKCFNAAKREAEGQMNKITRISELSWKEVFEDSYEIE